ncbi:MAG: hypothetical protein AAGG51_22970 [Cyanobacteria bacterium P01_G01_bin.54]
MQNQLIALRNHVFGTTPWQPTTKAALYFEVSSDSIRKAIAHNPDIVEGTHYLINTQADWPWSQQNPHAV